MSPRDPPCAIRFDPAIEQAPVAILFQDLGAILERMAGLRSAGVGDLKTYLDANPALLEELPTLVRGISANARARTMLRAAADVDPTALIQRFLSRPENRSIARDSLLALWDGAEVFEGEGYGETEDGCPIRLLVVLSLPNGRAAAARSGIYLYDRTEAAARETALRDSEERFRLVFERASHGMALLDARGHWIRVNGALARMLDRTDAQLQGLTVQDLLHPEDRAESIERLFGMTGCPDLTRGPELRFLRADGSTVWAEVSTAALPPHGDFRATAMMQVLDISDRKQAEAALTESQARFRQSFEHAGHGMALVSPDGHFLTANRVFCQTLDLSTETLATLSLDDLTPEDDREAERSARRAVLDGQSQSFSLDKGMIQPAGGSLQVRATATLIRDTAGQPLYFIYQLLNLTDHHLALARARAAERLLLGALDTITDDALLFDSAERLVLANTHFRDSEPALAPLLQPGTPFVTLIRAVAELDLVLPSRGRSIAEWLRWRIDQFRSQSPDPFEIQSPDGRWFLVRQGRAADGSTLILRSNITEIKQREAALQQAKVDAENANRAKSEFLANMSHELRTPLNAINGFSEVILKELYGPLGSPVYKDYMHNVLESGRHLLALINDILDLSRIEAGDLTLAESEQRPAALVAVALRKVVHVANEKGLTLVNGVPEELPLIQCDPQRMRQVLDNLLSNAIKFTPQGGAIAVRGRVTRSGQVVLSVSDTGVGMTADDIQIAIAKFGQVQSVFARIEGGTGLGLPLCRAMVEAHGGQLEIISQPGQGTTVSVHLPAWRVLPETAPM